MHGILHNITKSCIMNWPVFCNVSRSSNHNNMCTSKTVCLFVQKSPVTAMVYSENGKYFATGHKNGCIQLWEGMELN